MENYVHNDEMTELSDDKLEIHSHSKASEEYVEVNWNYEGVIYNWFVPIVYRRTGLDLSDQSIDVKRAYLQETFDVCHPRNWMLFKANIDKDWHGRKSGVTKQFLDVLSSDFTWKSVKSDLPANENPASRIKELKNQGYIIVQRTMRDKSLDVDCGHYLLLPIPKGQNSSYETWSPALRKRIYSLLQGKDVFENRVRPLNHLIIDHKFPEIRWDESTARTNLEALTDAEIITDFQLMDNQRNQQKREMCRTCLQTNERGFPLGIEFFYKGTIKWDSAIPKQGKAAEKGCLGCGWHDLAAWREALQKKLES